MLPNVALRRTENRVGLYAWAGPDTIRMTRLKYGDRSRIDEASFLELYNPDALGHLRATLGVTDMWVTYSWGFGDEAERAQREFLRSKLPNFRDAGIATHAYVQGFNVVTADFAERDFFCADGQGRRQPYARGRSLICPNAPATRELLLQRVRAASEEDVDGVFVDNMLFGVPPVAVYRDFLPPFGCACRWCKAAFERECHMPLPLHGIEGEEHIGAFLRFRAASIAHVIGECAALVRAKGKAFGVNLYDPLHHTPELYFGYGLESLQPHLDYHLIENHALRHDSSVENAHLEPLLTVQKPTFVVSYRDGIGRDGAYNQRDVDAIMSDAKAKGYAPCLKASEYIMDGVWHALRWQTIAAPAVAAEHSSDKKRASVVPPPSTALQRWLARRWSQWIACIVARAFAWGPTRKLLAQSSLYTKIVRKERLFAKEIWGLA